METEPGHGTRFYFTIVAQAVKLPLAARGAETSGLPTGTQAELRGKRVLIVDDHETNRRFILKLAEAWGMVPTAMTSGPEALQWIRRGERFELAILDMPMPDMDGPALGEEIRKTLDRDTPPTILVTSLGRREPWSEGLFAAALPKWISKCRRWTASRQCGVFTPNTPPTNGRGSSH